MSEFHGSIVAIVTPMRGGVAADAPLAWDQLANLIEFHIAEGTDGIVAVGTTGESATLNEAEHCEAIRRTVEIVRGRVPVIAGTGANSTTEAIELTRHAKEVGADACLLVTPYYNKPTQEGLFLHFKAVAEVIIYVFRLKKPRGAGAPKQKTRTAGAGASRRAAKGAARRPVQ